MGKMIALLGWGRVPVLGKDEADCGSLPRWARARPALPSAAALTWAASGREDSVLLPPRGARLCGAQSTPGEQGDRAEDSFLRNGSGQNAPSACL